MGEDRTEPDRASAIVWSTPTHWLFAKVCVVRCMIGQSSPRRGVFARRTSVFRCSCTTAGLTIACHCITRGISPHGYSTASCRLPRRGTHARLLTRRRDPQRGSRAGGLERTRCGRNSMGSVVARRVSQACDSVGYALERSRYRPERIGMGVRSLECDVIGARLAGRRRPRRRPIERRHTERTGVTARG